MNKLWIRAFWVLLALTAVCAISGQMEAAYALAVQTVISGNRATGGTTQGLNADRRVIDMSDSIHLLDPNLAPLTSITGKIRSAHTINPEFKWLEDDYLPTTSLVSATIGAASTTVEVTAATGKYFRVGDLLKSLDSGEVMYVSAVATDTLTIARSVGATAAAQLDQGETLLIVGNANSEGATGRAVKTTKTTTVNGYCQIFRWPFGDTRTTIQSEMYGGDDFAYQARKAGLEHKIQMERAYLFGEKSEDLDGPSGSGGTPFRTTDGVISRISTNTGTFASITLDAFEAELRDGFRYGPAEKMLFASRPIISFLNLLASASIETIPTTESFPLALTEYVSGHGKLYLVTHNLLEGAGANNTAYAGWALGIDLDCVFHRYLQGADTHIIPHIEANDEDGRRDEYLTESGLMLVQEKNHFLINNVTDYA